MTLFRALLAASCLALGACATAGTSVSLDGSRWQLASADKGALASPSAKTVTIEFTADRASGYGGCNQYSGSYTLVDGKLTVGPVMATKRGCMGDGNTIESAWFDALSQPLEVSQANGKLQLRAADGTTYEFATAAPKTP
jgi:heat shock protein HslJ